MKTFKVANVEKINNKFAKFKSSQFVEQVVDGKIKKVHCSTDRGIVSLVKFREVSESTLQYYKKPGFERIYNETKKQMDEYNSLSDKRVNVLSENSSFNKQTTTISKFMQTLHDAYDQHLNFALNPETVWYIISNEVASYVKNNSANPEIENLFTTTPGEKQKIIIEKHNLTYNNCDPDVWLSLLRTDFKKELLERVPSNIMDLMLPTLSTANPVNDSVHMIAFMDAASKYYEYGASTMCGIPEIKVNGSKDDWMLMYQSVKNISQLLPELSLYVKHLEPIFDNIISVMKGEDPDNVFWNSIYKTSNGSGGPYINGWAQNLYAHYFDYNRQSILKKEANYKTVGMFGGFKLNNFPSNVSCVDFEWLYYGQKLPMKFVGGISSVIQDDDGFLTPELDLSILEMEKIVK